ncbi:MAG: Dam family site-specific DNA-(adenine-N6)-methyltransferase [Acholeplasma sp.]|nr:Dam family site-specific DNA-(adenine-N6)-methyltransferase [Acholeplasma sp.]
MNPVLKWVGGKRQLLEKIKGLLPTEYNTYYEPFVGGGALLFELSPINAVINDMNSELINLYKILGDETKYYRLIELLEIHEKNHSEEYFYKIRELDRKDNFLRLPDYERAARVIYLNKAGYNGLYRVNSKGFYNVPFGKKLKVNLYSKENMDKVHNYFKNANISIHNEDFQQVVKEATTNDFVYFDPPYVKWDDKDSFTSYTKDDFSKDDQIRLFETVKELTTKNVKVMLSNHNAEFIRELYKDFNIFVIPAKRLVNANAKGRGNVEEVIITNYDV